LRLGLKLELRLRIRDRVTLLFMSALSNSIFESKVAISISASLRVSVKG
jgi:hypothetical protein